MTKNKMNYYKLKYDDGRIIHDKAMNDLEIIRRYDLTTKENMNTTIVRLEGEQRAIAISNEE